MIDIFKVEADSLLKLKEAHYKTRFSMAGLEGVLLANTIPHHFIILDIQLPDNNVLGALGHIV